MQQLVAAGCSTLLAVATHEHLACSVVGFLAFAWLLTRVPLSLTATHAYVNPVVAVV